MLVSHTVSQPPAQPITQHMYVSRRPTSASPALAVLLIPELNNCLDHPHVWLPLLLKPIDRSPGLRVEGVSSDD